MSFNSKAYFNYEQRLLDPDNVVSRGTYRRHKEVKPVTVIAPDPVRLSEYEDNKRQDAYVESKQHKQ